MMLVSLLVARMWPFLFLFVILPLMLMLLDDLVVSFIGGYYRKFIRIGPLFFLKLDVSSDRGTYYLKVFGVKVFEKPFVL